MNKQLYDTIDLIDAIDHIGDKKYKVIKGGISVHETDDLNDAQRVCYAHNGVIAGKGMLYCFSRIEPDK